VIKRLLVFNLAMDAADPALGFAVSWVSALARRVEKLHVITMRAGSFSVPMNVTVHSLGKERGRSEPARALVFYKTLGRVLRQGRVDACFSHMNPLFTVMAAPLLSARGVPVVTWFAHPALTRMLRLAHKVSAKMVSSLPGAYPYKKDKLVLIGQGIDTSLFRPLPTALWPAPAADEPTVLCVGRLSPVKDTATLLRAAAILRRKNIPFRVRLVGSPATPTDAAYADSLRELVETLGLADGVEFVPAMPREDLVPEYARAAVYVNLTPPGSGDKVALEAMACGVPTVVANTGFLPVLDDLTGRLFFRYGDADVLAEKLAGLLLCGADERRRLGLRLRERVETGHSLSGIADRLMAVLEDVVRRKRAAERRGLEAPRLVGPFRGAPRTAASQSDDGANHERRISDSGASGVRSPATDRVGATDTSAGERP